MKWFLGYLLFSIILSFIFTVVIINWVDNNESEISVEFVDGKVYMDISVNEIETCDNLIKELDIKSVVIKDKLYSPTCNRISKDLIRIVYAKDMDI